MATSVRAQIWFALVGLRERCKDGRAKSKPSDTCGKDRRQEIDIQDSTPKKNDLYFGCTQSQAWVNLQAVQSRAELFKKKGKQFREKDNYFELRHAKARRENRELASLDLPDHSPVFGRRMVVCCTTFLRNHGHKSPFCDVRCWPVFQLVLTPGGL